MSDVLAVVEHHRGSLRDVSLELVTAGNGLVSDTGGDLRPTIIGDDMSILAGELSLADVDAVHTAIEGGEFNHDVTVQAVETLAEELDPTYVLMGSTVNDLNHAPAVVERFDHPPVIDAIGLEDGGDLIVTREIYASKVESAVEVNADHAAVMIHPGEWDTTEEQGEFVIEAFSFDLDESCMRSRVTGSGEVDSGNVDITDTDVLVFIGCGIEEEENIEFVQEFADALGATLSSSWPIVDNDWFPKDRQVDRSGKIVTPKFYIATGISGAVRHVARMKDAESIVAINTDLDAPIFDIASYGVVGDLFDVVPELIGQFE